MGEPGEPTLAEVRAEFPGWECWEGVDRLCYARHTGTGTEVEGEDPLDLRDQIRAADRLRGYAEDAEDPEVAEDAGGADRDAEAGR